MELQIERQRIRNTFKNLIKDTKEAIVGTDRDFTKGNITRSVIILSIPMVLEMIMESAFAIFDILFVAKLGSDAVATVGITESLITIVYAIGIGLGIGTTAMVSRRIGEKKHKEASIVAFHGIFAGVVASSIIAIPGIFFPEDLLNLMGISTQNNPELASYTSIMIGFNIVILMLFIINSIYRSAGDASIAMRVLFLANFLNIILDPLLIFGIGIFPELGIKGAAIATTIGRGTAVLYQLYILIRGNHRIKLISEYCRIRISILIKLIKLSLGGIGQLLIATTSWILLVRILAVFGTETVAGYTVAIRVMIFALLPSVGLSNATSTLVGQNLGSKQADRASRVAWFTGKINMILLFVISIIFLIWTKQIISLFIDEENVIQYGTTCLRILSYGFIVYGLGMVMVHAINGAGDTKTPTLINLFAFWIIEIPLAYTLAIVFDFNEKGVYYSIIIAETVLTLCSVIVFNRGKWKKNIV